MIELFDHGAALLSDTTMDYPMNVNYKELVEEVKPKTFAHDFIDQLGAVERIYKNQIKFTFNKKDIERILEEEPYYSKEIKNRVKNIFFTQMRKYEHLFEKEKNNA